MFLLAGGFVLGDDDQGCLKEEARPTLMAPTSPLDSSLFFFFLFIYLVYDPEKGLFRLILNCLLGFFGSGVDRLTWRKQSRSFVPCCVARSLAWTTKRAACCTDAPRRRLAAVKRLTRETRPLSPPNGKSSGILRTSSSLRLKNRIRVYYKKKWMKVVWS
jgi:hypothetical protein